MPYAVSYAAITICVLAANYTITYITLFVVIFISKGTYHWNETICYNSIVHFTLEKITEKNLRNAALKQFALMRFNVVDNQRHIKQQHLYEEDETYSKVNRKILCTTTCCLSCSRVFADEEPQFHTSYRLDFTFQKYWRSYQISSAATCHSITS